MQLGDIISLFSHLAGIGLAVFGVVSGNHEATAMGIGLAGGTGVAAHLPTSMFNGGAK